jgi:hypothetical protein
MNSLRTAWAATIVGALLMAGCAAPPATPGPATTVTPTPPPSVVVLNPQTSGKILAERIKAQTQ